MAPPAGAQEDAVPLRGFQEKPSQGSLPASQAVTARERADWHHCTAYGLWGADLFAKQFPSYAKGVVSGGTTLAHPSSLFTQRPSLWHQPQASRAPRRYPSRRVGKHPPRGPPAQRLSMHPALCFVVRLQEGFYFFYLVSLWYPFNL